MLVLSLACLPQGRRFKSGGFTSFYVCILHIKANQPTDKKKKEKIKRMTPPPRYAQNSYDQFSQNAFMFLLLFFS